MEPAGGVQEDHVVAVAPGVLHGGLGDVHRVGLTHLEDGDVQLSAHHLQLLDGGGTVDIAGHQQRALALLLHQPGQLCPVGGLARPLQAHQHDDGGRGGGDLQLAVAAPHKGGEFLVDDLDDHLSGGEGFHHIGTHCPFRDGGDEVFDHLEVDVRLQQGHFNFLHGLLHVGLGQAALAPQPLEGGGKFFG